MKWQISDLGEFYDPTEATVVYFAPKSGDTHLISEFAAHIIETLSREPMDLESLVENLSQHIEPEARESLPGTTRAIVEELADLDILKPS